MKRFLVISLIGLWPFTPSSSIAVEKIRFATHFKRNPHYVAPVVAAQQKGYWKAEGLELAWVPFDSATTMIQALAAGELDVGTHSLDSALISYSRGVPEIIVGDPKMRTDFYLWVLADSPVKEAKELRGAKVGFSRLGVALHRYAEIAARALGMEKNIKFLGVGGGGPAIAALKTGAVDALGFSFFTMAPLVAKGEVRQVVRLNDYVAGDPGGTQVIYARREFLREHLETVSKAIRAFMAGAQFVLANRAWAMELMKTQFGYSDQIAGLAFDLFFYGRDAKIEPDKIKQAIDFLVEYRFIPKEKAPGLDEVYAREFAR